MSRFFGKSLSLKSIVSKVCKMTNRQQEYETIIKQIRFNRQMQKKRLYEQAKRSRKNQSNDSKEK